MERVQGCLYGAAIGASTARPRFKSRHHRELMRGVAEIAPHERREEAPTMRTSSRLRRVLLLAGIGVGLMVAQPVSAQALGDADCPGGYYYAPGYNVCFPYGYDPRYAYDPGYAS